MQPEFETKTPSLAASTELLVMAPIKPGFVPTLDTVTYKSRVKILLKQLHASRQGLHEYRPLRAVSDAVERVGVIRSLRVAVVEGAMAEEDRILLSVHFDGSYEAYARTIWQRSARLLDLIFCNADHYVTGWDHSFDAWNGWIRSVQVATPFFYATPGLTYQDQTYLQMLVRRDHGAGGDELARTRIAIPTAEQIAWSIMRHDVDPTRRDDGQEAQGPLVKAEKFRQNLGALAALYRLADWYRPGTADGDVLRHAAHELLPQLADIFLPGGYNAPLAQAAIAAGGAPLQRPLAWFMKEVDKVPATRAGTPLPTDDPTPEVGSDAQGGILEPFEEVTQGAMVLLAFDNPEGAAALLQVVQTDPVCGARTAKDKALVNLALTFEGLRACGLSGPLLESWPLEFRQGMAARAGLLGDIRWNHPRRWTLPRRNGALPLEPGRDDRQLPGVPLESVHAIVQFRVRPSDPLSGSAETLLTQAIEGLRDVSGVSLLSVQWMKRRLPIEPAIDHFGYTDGQSQPVYGPAPSEVPYSNQVHLGEVVLGHPNAADRVEDQDLSARSPIASLVRNGSFLVVRKLRQNVRVFREVVTRAAGLSGLKEADIRARMMGRWPADAGALAGRPLAPLGSGGTNDFDYRGDEHGELTPLAAHIRRANPRGSTLEDEFPKPAPGGRPPRIVRRGLPYGTPPEEHDEPDADRGLVFMAYNASIAEQFEVVQGWLSGGNSSGGYSGAGCPFLAVPEAGMQRHFRFQEGDRTVHMPLDGQEDLGTEPEPLVSLQWGLYAFAPSRSAQGEIAKIAAAAGSAVALPWSAERGRTLIAKLQQLEQQGGGAAAQAWKAALEDPESVSSFDSASIWAAVRQFHGGLLRIPYGVLVATPSLVHQVLTDEVHFTVSGYGRRLVAAGMGEIFLGRDADDPDYAALSDACNQAILGIGMQEAFDQARGAAQAVLDVGLEHAQVLARQNGDTTWEAGVDPRDLISQTLATLCEAWFGLDDQTAAPGSDHPLFARGTLDWEWRPGDPVFYPGHFTAASRATFQPEPSAEVLSMAGQHGQALTAALRALIEARGAAAFQAPVSRRVLDSLWASRPQDAVHTIAGALMGFLPTTEGVMRRIFAEWTRDGTLLELAGRSANYAQWDEARDAIDPVLRHALKFRPVPEQIWREARKPLQLKGDAGHSVDLAAGDKLVVGQVSVTHAQLDLGERADVFAMFGGRRASGQPTHACPGYAASLGAMVGLLAAVLAPSQGQLVPGPAGALVYRGKLHTEKTLAGAARLMRGDIDLAGAAPWASEGDGRALMGFGDSWLRFRVESDEGGDLMRALGQMGYDVSRFAPNDSAHEGYRLAQMATQRPGDGGSVYGWLRKQVQDGRAPFAVLLDGGGNDFVDSDQLTSPVFSCKPAGQGSVLDQFLLPMGNTPSHDEAVLDKFLRTMTGKLSMIVTELAKAGGGAGTPGQVPIIVVAYDHPIPDGRSFSSLLTCPWLWPNFLRKGYTVADRDAAAKEMAFAIDALNDAYEATVQALARDQHIKVQFVRLTGVLAATAAYQARGHTAVWRNEMHPNREGFAALARHLHDKALLPLAQAQAPA